MPRVTYVQPDGSATAVELARGESVMDGALDNAIPGIIGQCGGGCTCATCHCYVGAEFLPRLAPPGPDERDMLEYVWRPRFNSRLSCQVKVDESLDGLVVHVPGRQA